MKFNSIHSPALAAKTKETKGCIFILFHFKGKNNKNFQTTPLLGIIILCNLNIE